MTPMEQEGFIPEHEGDFEARAADKLTKYGLQKLLTEQSQRIGVLIRERDEARREADSLADQIRREQGTWLETRDANQRLTSQLTASEQSRRALEAGLRPPHKCKCIARIHNMMPGRDWWLGELTEKVSEWPHETHCLHIKTPLKEIVLLCNMGDLQGLTVLCDIPWPIVNATWRERMTEAYKRAALQPPGGPQP